MARAFPFYKQPDQKACGPTCLRIIAKHYGKTLSLGQINRVIEANRLGVSLGSLGEAAEKIGFRTLGVNTSFAKLLKEQPVPFIAFWRENHFVVVYKIAKGKVHVSDPAHGILTYSYEEFIENWTNTPGQGHEAKGIALLLQPTPTFAEEEWEKEDSRHGFSYLFKYLFRYRQFLIQLVISLLGASLLQLIFPFLTQSLVDLGIQNQDVGLIYLILLAQLMVFLGRSSLEIIRNWILLHLSTRINISILSDFFIKLMKLPIAFFDSKLTGDLLQRINDHRRLENLLTSTSLSTLFSVFTLLIFGGVLAFYSWVLFGVFLLGTALYFGWVLLFFKRRRDLDYKNFQQVSQEQSKVIELIHGMQEIKLNTAEREMRWGWEHIQTRLFRIAMKSLSLQQKQTIGSSFINELKNILITFLAAQFVIQGQMTLGMMLAVSYIIGQLNGPIAQLVGLLTSVQDANISLDRLGEIYDRADEEPEGVQLISRLPEQPDIHLEEVVFSYEGVKEPVLKGLTLTIPANKTTAIVGVSGSGKTTLMKMLLGFYAPQEGKITVGGLDLKSISPRVWRQHCGVVMQEGYLFNASVAENIAVGQEVIDEERLAAASQLACIDDFIASLPMGYNTTIGMEGIGISTGQKQRVQIARAVYKQPQFMLFDEATSALDANNERKIMENLNAFFQNRTAIVIAHRLSTVQNADQIVVLEKGQIVEQGPHEALIEKQGAYYHLVRNQLQLERLNGAAPSDVSPVTEAKP
ncbi:MAG TPA: ABC transporter ATP-binding protein [Cytophagales bacterium]|nr:ABC transporter ATP-binding protein [Cytophagales bacterium]HAP60522.1 ABC transporter ATP-binding protein [Cytophagales bacterium]